MNADPYARYHAAMPPVSSVSPNNRPPVSALLSFPVDVLLAYVYPIPAMFARQRRDLVASNLLVCLALLLLTGLCNYIWGRLSSLNHAMVTLSFAHLAPHPLSIAAVVVQALVTPGLILAFAGALHFLARKQKGRGSYRAQLYSVLLIATPPILLGVAVVLLLCIVPNLAGLIRVPFIVATLLLCAYSLFLHVPALMGIQQLKASQAVLCVALIVIVVVLVFTFADSSNHNGEGGNNQSGGGRSSGSRNRKARFCPQCGFSLEVYDQIHRDAPTQVCPRCGGPLPSF